MKNPLWSSEEEELTIYIYIYKIFSSFFFYLKENPTKYTTLLFGDFPMLRIRITNV